MTARRTFAAGLAIVACVLFALTWQLAMAGDMTAFLPGGVATVLAWAAVGCWR